MLCQDNGSGGSTAQDDTEDRKVREGIFPVGVWEKVLPVSNDCRSWTVTQFRY